MGTRKLFNDTKLTSWRMVAETAESISLGGWVFRGQENSAWELQTSLEREYGGRGAAVEQELLRHFLRSAPRLLPSHLVPDDDDASAWLGLIQHYGGPTRFLDVTRSPFVALFFAFENAGDQDRVVWAIDSQWDMHACAQTMAANESITVDAALERTTTRQKELVSSLVWGRPDP